MVSTSAILLAVACTLAVVLVMAGLPFCLRECRKQKGDVPKVAPALQDAGEDSTSSDSDSESSAPPSPDVQARRADDAAPSAAPPSPDVQPSRADDAAPSAAVDDAQQLLLEAPNISAAAPTATEVGEDAACEHQCSSGVATRRQLPPLVDRPIPPPISRHISRRRVPPDSS